MPQSESIQDRPAPVGKTVLYISLLLTFLFVIWGAAFPENLDVVAGRALNFITVNFGWLYLIAVFFVLLFVIGIAVSPFGKIKLGGDDEKPEFTTPAWFAMLFTTGMGIGLVFWSIAEPITHFMSPPYGEAGTAASAELAMRYTFFHWGLHPWAVFALVGLALAYFQFRKGMPALISSIFQPILGEGVHGPIGKAIDILAVFATVFGLGTSLGLGTMQINTGLNMLYGVPENNTINILIIAVITGVFTLAAVLGIEKGIKFIANNTVRLALLIMVFLLLFGPTRSIFNLLTSTIGDYLQNLIYMSLWTDPINEGGWINGWTVFYWAWWIAWGPFVGQFIARISRGRTIREFIIGSLVAPTAFSFIWLAIFGGTALNLDILGNAGIGSAVSENIASALFVTLGNFPLSAVTSLLAIILIAAFFITSADSGTFVVAMLTSGGDQEPDRKLKAAWGILLGGVAAVLLVAGGLGALQTASIASAFPFMLIMLVMCYSLVKSFADDRIK
ncbi:MAG: BCCT family transporter [Bacillota bacterium]|nr:BCCT family transporter [Bacillota bacterium]